MKKFLVKFLVFVLPIILPLGLLECGIRNIPNDYSYKNEYMNNNSKNIETLIIGSSHSYLGVNPEFLDSKSFNLSHLWETLEYDDILFNNFKDNLQNLKIVVIPISYHSLFNRGMKNKKNYNIYYHLKETDFLVDNLEILNKNLLDLIEDCYSYYYLKQPSPYLKSSTLGWHEKMEGNVEDYILASEKIAKLHTKDNFNELEFNINVLEDLIYQCEKKGVKVIMVTTPVHVAYNNALKKDQLDVALSTANKLATQFKNVSYYNFLESSLFLEPDFKDGDHLNALGAKKLTLILNDIINEKLKDNE
jgi:hypothetical protein